MKKQYEKTNEIRVEGKKIQIIIIERKILSSKRHKFSEIKYYNNFIVNLHMMH